MDGEEESIGRIYFKLYNTQSENYGFVLKTRMARFTLILNDNHLDNLRNKYRAFFKRSILNINANNKMCGFAKSFFMDGKICKIDNGEISFDAYEEDLKMLCYMDILGSRKYGIWKKMIAGWDKNKHNREFFIKMAKSEADKRGRDTEKIDKISFLGELFGKG